MINVFIRGFCDELFRERLLFKSLKTLTKTAQYAACLNSKTLLNEIMRRLLQLLKRSNRVVSAKQQCLAERFSEPAAFTTAKQQWLGPLVTAWTRAKKRSKRKFLIEKQRLSLNTSERWRSKQTSPPRRQQLQLWSIWKLRA